MSEQQNTPPHAILELIIHEDLRVTDRGLENSHLRIIGCTNCLSMAIADYITKHPALLIIITHALLIAQQQKPQQ